MNDAVEKALATAKKHPGRKTARNQIIVATMLLVAAAALATTAPIVALSLAALAPLFLWAARSILRDVTQLAFFSPAYAAVTRGDHETARALLDAASERKAAGPGRRIISLVRTMLAFEDADARGVVKHATDAMVIPPGLVLRDAERIQIGVVQSMRALARATLRDEEGALADADRACEDGFASTDSIVYSELARAVVAANRQQKPEVRAILTRSAPFVDTLGGRQRELLKRLSRYAAAQKRSVYRHAAKPEEETVDTWLSQPATTKMDSLPAPAAALAIKPPDVKKPHTFHAARFLVAWIVAMVTVLAAWHVLHPSPVEPRPPGDETRFASMIVVGAVAFVYALVARNLFVAARKRIARHRAQIGVLRGDAKALATLEKQARQGAPYASLTLATMAERAARFDEAISRCDVGIGFANSTEAARMMYHDIIAPALHAERAFCYAALGKSDEANAILASMPNASSYALGATARFRVLMAQALARGDRTGALAIARGRSDALPLTMRDAFVIDLLEATEGRGADDEEWARLHAELAADPSLAKWVDHFMPKSTLERRVAVHEDEELEESEAAEAAEQS